MQDSKIVLFALVCFEALFVGSLRLTSLHALSFTLRALGIFSTTQLIRELNLDYVTENPWVVIPISAMRTTNVDQVVQWIIRQQAKQ